MEVAAQDVDALAEADEAPSASAGERDLRAGAVRAHLHGDLLVAVAYADRSGAAVSVLEGVRQGFLDHPVGDEVGAAGGFGGGALLGELHGLSGPPGLFDEGEEPADGRRGGLGAVVGVEQVEQVPQVGDGPCGRCR